MLAFSQADGRRVRRHSGPPARCRTRRIVVAFLLMAPGGCGAGDTAVELSAAAGYPESTSRVVVALPGLLRKHCHASLVHPQWVITAAHCFSGANVEGGGSLEDFDRTFSLSDVRYHPGAHVSGETRRSSTWTNEELSAAHDLALVPFYPPLTSVTPLRLGAPADACGLSPLTPRVASLGQRDAQGAARTAEVELMGLRDASELLGEGQSGTLLAARGTRVHPGDSGSGLSLHVLQAPRAPGCLTASEGAAAPAPRLVGVLQNASTADDWRPFGAVPTELPENADWIARTLRDETPPSEPARPRLEP